ncbi:phytanoyl-CoA dioxygenase family protein [Candidatus Poribacteria bacterium]|nr:phytanoyl-CoA dioxygenase family protein [Candidatus Poribacteria bacterium]
MEFVPLTEAQRQEFDKNGYFIVRSVLDNDMITRLIEAGDRIVNSRDSDAQYVHIRDGLVQEPAFAELTSQTTAIPLVIQLLGTNLHITNTALLYKNPQPKGLPENRGWHRDVGLHLDLGHKNCPRVGLKIAYCLTDCHVPDAGATLFIPGSHVSGKPLEIPEGEIDPIEPYAEPLLRAGDAYFFENRIYHTTGQNYTDQTAKLVIYGYHYAWLKPEGYLLYYNDKQQPDENVLQNVDDLGKQFLGGGGGAAAQWAAEHNLSIEQEPQVVTI